MHNKERCGGKNEDINKSEGKSAVWPDHTLPVGLYYTFDYIDFVRIGGDSFTGGRNHAGTMENSYVHNALYGRYRHCGTCGLLQIL